MKESRFLAYFRYEDAETYNPFLGKNQVKRLDRSMMFHAISYWNREKNKNLYIFSLPKKTDRAPPAGWT